MLDTLAEAWADDQRRREHLGRPDADGSSTRSRSPASSSGRSPSRLTEGLEGRDPRPGGARRSHPDQAGLRHRHHRAHQPARAPQRLLLEVRQRQALDRQVVHDRGRQHLVRAHRAHVGRRTECRDRRRDGSRSEGTNGSASTAAPARGPRPWRRPRNPRLRVHPHRRHQGSDRRAVWRRHAVRRDHRQPAVPARTTAATATSARPIYQDVRGAGARRSTRATPSMVTPSRWFAGGQGTRRVPRANALRPAHADASSTTRSCTTASPA